MAVIGAGRIGTLRARLAAQHPGVRYIAVSDREPARARELAQQVGAQSHSGDNLEVISRPEVNAVIVSTSEGEHMAPVLAAVAQGKAVLVEKPIALTLADADAMVEAIEKNGASVRVGYSRRYKERYLIAKEQIVQGRIGRMTGAAARVYNSRSQALAILKRHREATPVVDALTYYVDLMSWLQGGTPITEVYARGQKGVLKEAGFDVDDVSWAVFTYADGTVINLGISYALPEKYPARGHAARVEVLGTGGVMILDDDHTDQLMYTEKGIPHVYLPDQSVNMVFLQSGTPGDWALGDFWGPIANETRAWLDHLSMGRPCVLATPREARATLEATLAIEHSIAARRPVMLPLAR
ncbi:MAG: Gfo/Idh/MocA family oxidoreductase [Betaproteobacteria bacterium]|nr:Gfo/Idh/MocA family oxidoreductase [Betaproteobacteria bacterium]MDH3437780.1 Gfo/Idh/MocA family oxidoreductase [Betaproteobacteria bacterium]